MSKRLTIKIELELHPEQLAAHFLFHDFQWKVIPDSWNLMQKDLDEKIQEALMEADPVVGHLWKLVRMPTVRNGTSERDMGFSMFRTRVAKMAREYLLKNYAVPELFHCSGKENRLRECPE